MQKAFSKYIFSLLLFGSNGIIASMIALSSYEIVLLRTLLGSIFLVAIFFLTHGKVEFYKYKKDFVFLCFSGIGMGASWMLLYEAYQQIGVSIATLCYNCGPVIVMMLSPLIFKEKLTWAKIVGFLSVFVGVFLVNGQGDVSTKSWGIICGLLSAATYAVMVICNKKAKAITGLENSMLQLIIAFITVAIFVGIKQGFAMKIEATSILPILILGFVNTGIGCYLYFSSIGHLQVQTVAICGYLELLSAVLFSMVFLNERMLPIQIVGGVLIIGGAIVGECVKRKAK